MTVIIVSPFSSGGKNIENGELYISAITRAIIMAAIHTIIRRTKANGNKHIPAFINIFFTLSNVFTFALVSDLLFFNLLNT